MTDSEHKIKYDNAKSEWEEEFKFNLDCDIKDHKDQCTKNNFGVKSFGLNTPFNSKIRLWTSHTLHYGSQNAA